MKKIILTSAIIFATAVGAFAQAPMPITSGTANLKVVLHKVQSIVVNNPEVTLDYKTIDNYNTGVTEKKVGHLTVYSVGGFEVNVKSGSNTLTTDATQAIESSGIKVQASGNALTTNYPEVYLTDEPTILFTSAVGGLNQVFDVTYVGDKDLAYANAEKFKEDQTTTTHSVDVIYSIIAK